jgi:hypothetical protein
MYKEKLNEWGLAKYVPSSTATWIMENEKQRRIQGKPAASYKFGGRPLDMADVERKAKRAKVHANLDSGASTYIITPGQSFI